MPNPQATPAMFEMRQSRFFKRRLIDFASLCSIYRYVLPVVMFFQCRPWLAGSTTYIQPTITIERVQFSHCVYRITRRQSVQTQNKRITEFCEAPCLLARQVNQFDKLDVAKTPACSPGR